LSSAKDLLSRFGGHSAASGFELHSDRLSAVIERLDSYFFELHEKPKALEIFYDVEARLGDVGAPLMRWYDFVGPFGVGFSIPLIYFQKVILHSKKSLKGGHWRLRLVGEDNQSSHEALLFSPSPRQLQVLESEPSFLDILGELQWNYFAGQKSVQILIRDLKLSN
jgi:single-stranded-DNA-specific exonuclease